MPAPTLPIEGEGALGKYPHLFPPDGFIQFDRNNRLEPVPIGAEQTLETIKITSGYVGWIREIGLEASDWGVIFFTIYDDNAPLRDYTRIVVPLGSPTTPKQVFIPIRPNSPITLRCTASGATSARWSVFGWYYPEKR